MIEHRAYLIQHYQELTKLITESIEYIPDCEIEFLVREMSILLEYAERHIDGDA